MAYDIDGVKHTVAKTTVKAPTTVAKAPAPPTVYWFGGKSYTSQAAYQAAVAASKAAAAAAAEAKKRAAAAAAELQASAAARAANESKMAAYRNEAAAAAKKRSDQIRAQALKKLQSQKMADFERAAGEHLAARAALGYERVDGVWIDPAEVAQASERSKQLTRHLARGDQT